MGNYPHPIVAQEGWAHLAIAVIVAGVATAFFGWWSAPLWLVVVFVLQFFRDPPRAVPQGEGLVLCPADGRVLVVGAERDPYLERDALKVSIFMNVFNVHSNRSPVAGTVREVKYSAGLFVNASFDKASTGNERNAIVLATADGRGRHLRAGRRAHRAAHPLLREGGRPPRSRPALRLHPLRLARGRVPAAGLERPGWRSATR